MDKFDLTSVNEVDINGVTFVRKEGDDGFKIRRVAKPGDAFLTKYGSILVFVGECFCDHSDDCVCVCGGGPGGFLAGATATLRFHPTKPVELVAK